MENKTLCFDCDGTFVDLYGVDNWLEYLRSYDPKPYVNAKPLINLSLFARLLNKAQSKGYKLIIISWLSKNSTPEYDRLVTAAKLAWLKRHLPSIKFDDINIIGYGIPKSNYGSGILFDDEFNNRKEWVNNGGIAYDEKDMMAVLRKL